MLIYLFFYWRSWYQSEKQVSLQVCWIVCVCVCVCYFFYGVFIWSDVTSNFKEEFDLVLQLLCCCEALQKAVLKKGVERGSSLCYKRKMENLLKGQFTSKSRIHLRPLTRPPVWIVPVWVAEFRPFLKYDGTGRRSAWKDRSKTQQQRLEIILLVEAIGWCSVAKEKIVPTWNCSHEGLSVVWDIAVEFLKCFFFFLYLTKSGRLYADR